MTDAGEVAELAAPSGDFLPDPRDGSSAVHDGLTLEDLILLDALPLRSTSSVEKLCTVAGLAPEAVRAGLGRLGLLGLAESRTGRLEAVQKCRLTRRTPPRLAATDP